MSSNLTIAISGKSGCGNTTVSAIVAERLNLRLINYTFHTIAEEMGLTFEEVCRRAELDSSYDYRVDERQIALASGGNCVLGSRLAIWLLQEADLRFYLEAAPETRAKRIQKREGGDLNSVLAEMDDRDRRDRARYIRLYDIDINTYDFADYVIDTEAHDQNQVAEIIIEAALERVP